MTSVPGAAPGRPAAPRTIRVATRSSPQATAQASVVADALAAAGFATELVMVDTHGDRTQAAQVPLHTIGGQGVFTKEIQVAVLDGRADVAVHSAKDLPTEPVPGLSIGALPARRDPRDALIGRALDDLPVGATIATGSVRRRAQLAVVRPDLDFVELRGNIHTRLSRIPDGGSIVMAVAALEVLGIADRVAEILDPSEFVPAVGQGAVAVECRSDDLDVLAEKVDAGATRAITQMCFDHDAFARYLDAVRARRIDVEIVPGIFPIHSLPAVARFTARCGASIPSAVARRFDRFEDDPTATADIVAEFAAEQIRRLDLLGVEHVHLYTLNQADLALDVCGRISTSERARA